LAEAINMLRRVLVQSLDLSQDDQCIIDSLPVPVVEFHLAPGSTGDWRAYGAAFGKVPSKKQTIFGYKLHLLTTLSGVILDFELAPANESDLAVGAELLATHTDLMVLGDKGYVSDPVANDLWEHNRVHLLTLRRANQLKQLPQRTTKLINQVRQMIETVNGQLTSQFNIEHNPAHTFYGLCARLYTKLTAHTLCIYINRLLEKPNVLQIKSLAFPNI
jgi:DDE family transposase